MPNKLFPKFWRSCHLANVHKYVFYIGATIYELGSANYVKEALACVMDSQRNPVLFPKDADACSIDQVLENFGFQVINLTQRSQYCEIRMLETCIQSALHDLPGRLWLNRGPGTYLSKVDDVKRVTSAKLIGPPRLHFF